MEVIAVVASGTNTAEPWQRSNPSAVEEWLEPLGWQEWEPGTLNLASPDWPEWLHGGGIRALVPPIPCEVNGVTAAIVKTLTPETCEIMAAVNLRAALELEDRDMVRVRFDAAAP